MAAPRSRCGSRFSRLWANRERPPEPGPAATLAREPIAAPGAAGSNGHMDEPRVPERSLDEEVEDMDVSAADAEDVMGGTPHTKQKADGSLDAGIFFKYDLKAQKEG